MQCDGIVVGTRSDRIASRVTIWGRPITIMLLLAPSDALAPSYDWKPPDIYPQGEAVQFCFSLYNPSGLDEAGRDEFCAGRRSRHKSIQALG